MWQSFWFQPSVRGEHLHTCVVVRALRSLLHSVKCPHRNRHLHISQLPDHMKIVQMAHKYRSFSLCSSATRCNTSESGQTKQRHAVLQVGEKRNVYWTHRERKFQYLVYTDSRVVIAITDLRGMQEYRAKKQCCGPTYTTQRFYQFLGYFPLYYSSVFEWRLPMAFSSNFTCPLLIELLAGTDWNKLTTINRHFYYEEATGVAIAPAN
jgi:hypothetical protein